MPIAFETILLATGFAAPVVLMIAALANRAVTEDQARDAQAD